MPNAEKSSAVAEITQNFTTPPRRSSPSTAACPSSRSPSCAARWAATRPTPSSKNTLTKRAAADAGVPLDDSLLAGPTAIAFVKGDPVEAAKGLRDFAKTNAAARDQGRHPRRQGAVCRRGQQDRRSRVP